ncbi:MAG TPA: ATP-binding protein [Pirellulales bacterium]|nr:ATP-binding protein [Pirellulales bacterium]
MVTAKSANPYRPGAGHMPVYLAGREQERDEFARLLAQKTVFQNMVLTGLRGVGKTVLLETLKPLAIKQKWLWVGTDLSEAASISEERIAVRLMTDMSVVTAALVAGRRELRPIGFRRSVSTPVPLTFPTMLGIFQQTPGLISDKLKAVLELVWSCLRDQQPRIRGIVFAYDEAQNMSDHAGRNEFPLSLMLDVFQSIQKKEIPFMLMLVGLPTLFPKLVEARTYSERMFHIVTLDRLNEAASRDAILKPISDARCPVKFSPAGINAILAASGGYPYFLQFICREAFDAYLQDLDKGGSRLLIGEITRKLDSDFFAARWSRATDRQRTLLAVIANVDESDTEFTVRQIEEKARELLARPFSKSQISQMLAKLAQVGLVYKNRHGKYAFAVPLLGQFIKRQIEINGDWWDEELRDR